MCKQCKKLYQKWKGFNMLTRVLLVITWMAVASAAVTFVLIVATSGGTSLSKKTTDRINTVFIISLVATLPCMLAWVIYDMRRQSTTSNS